MLPLLLFLLLIDFSQAAPIENQTTTSRFEELILKNMNLSADPCSEFYNYACGGWIEANPLPPGKTSLRRFDMLSLENLKKLQNVLEEDSDRFNTSAFRKLKLFHRKCMDNSTIDNQHMFQAIKSIGEFPMGDDDMLDFDFTDLIIKLDERHNPFFDFKMQMDYKNPRATILTLDTTRFKLGHLEMTNYLKDQDKFGKIFGAYEEYIGQRVAFLANITSSNAAALNMSEIVDEIVQFQYALGSLSSPSFFPYEFKLPVVKALFPMLDWDRYLAVKVPEGFRMDNYTDIRVMAVASMQKVVSLINITKPRTIWNYAILEYSRTFGYSIEEELHTQTDKLQEALGVTDYRKERWVSCVSTAINHFSHSIGALYVHNFFNAESKEKVTNMTTAIQRAVKSIFDDVSWLDKSTKSSAQLKLKEMLFHIGYADWILDDDKLDEYYEKLIVSDDVSLEEYMNIIRKWREDTAFLKQNVTRTRHEQQSDFSPASVNAVMNQIFNKFEIFAGLLQPPFFYNDLPMVINFGASGSFIGHEIFHGFDPNGARFDHEGRHREWWNMETTMMFHEKIHCFVQQYNNETVEEVGMKLDGFSSKGENIADNAGLKASFEAYKSYVAQNGAESQVHPDFANEQLFFIGYAQQWCENQNNEFLVNRIVTDVHTIGRFRATVTSRNQKAFAQVFNCPVGSNMNPEERCEVW